MPYGLSTHAQTDLIDIYIEGAQQFGIEQANRYHDDLAAVFGLLGEFPEMARLREEISPPVRIHPFKSHLIVYEITGEKAYILRIRHSRENWISAPTGNI